MKFQRDRSWVERWESGIKSGNLAGISFLLPDVCPAQLVLFSELPYPHGHMQGYLCPHLGELTDTMVSKAVLVHDTHCLSFLQKITHTRVSRGCAGNSKRQASRSWAWEAWNRGPSQKLGKPGSHVEGKPLVPRERWWASRWLKSIWSHLKIPQIQTSNTSVKTNSASFTFNQGPGLCT